MSFRLKPIHLIPLSIFLVSCIIYSSTVATSMVNIADSAELVTAAYHLGIAHPPGYPLYTGFLYLVMHLPFVHHPAATAHLTSAFFQSLSLVIFYLCTQALLQRFSTQTATRIPLGIIATATFGFSYFYWEQATYAEVFPLQNIFIGLILLFLCKNEGLKHGLRISFLFGLAATQHQTIIFLVPAAMYAAKQSKQSIPWIKYLIVAAVAFLIPYLILALVYRLDAPLSWQFDRSLTGIWQLIMRRVYAATPAPSTGISHMVNSVITLLTYLVQHLSLPAVLAAGIGLMALYKRNRHLFTVFGTTLVVAGPLFAAYLKFPLPGNHPDYVYYYSSYLSLRMFRLFEYIAALLIPLGLLTVLHQIRVKPQLLLMVFTLLPFVQLVRNYPIVNKRHYQYDSQYATEVLKTLPPATVLLIDSDDAFGLLYTQTIENIRPDVILVPTAMHMRWGYLQSLLPSPIFAAKGYYELILSVTQWGLLQQRPVFVLEPRSPFINQMKTYRYQLTPQGYANRITTTPIPSIPYGSALTSGLLAQPTHPQNLWQQFIRTKINRNLHPSE